MYKLLAILTAWAVTYAVRVLPLTLIRREIKSPFLRSFLYYVPYVTLAVMTFPDIVRATGNLYAAWVAFVAALVLAWKGKSLLTVACAACAVEFVMEWLLPMIGLV